MRRVCSLRGILRYSLLQRAAVPQLEQLLARAGIYNQDPCRYSSSESTLVEANSDDTPVPKRQQLLAQAGFQKQNTCHSSVSTSEVANSEETPDLEEVADEACSQEAAEDEACSEEAAEDEACSEEAAEDEACSKKAAYPDLAVVPWGWRRADTVQTVWIHKDPQNAGRISALDYVIMHKPIVSKCLYGERWLSDVTTKDGVTLVSSITELFEYMRLRGWSFYDPLTAEMLVVDDRGRVHIADGVILRCVTQFSHSLDIIFGADAMEDLLFYRRQGGVRYPPEIVDILVLMRSPWLQPEYLMLIHPAGIHEHQRSPAYMKLFDFVIYGIDRNQRELVLQYIQDRAHGWGTGVIENMLLRQYFFHDENKSYDPENARDGMFLRRHGECHILNSFWIMKFHGFPYSREDQQLLLHDKLGMFTSLVHRSLWRDDENSRKLLKELHPEEHLCKIGCCCPMGECIRVRVYEREVTRWCQQSDEQIQAIVGVANMIRGNGNVNDSDIITQPQEWYDMAYCKPSVPQQFDKVIVDFYAYNKMQLTVRAGDVVELLYEPEHCFSEKELHKRYCYVRDAMGNVGFVRVFCLQKYDYLFY